MYDLELYINFNHVNQLTFSNVAGRPVRSHENGIWWTKPTESVMWATMSDSVSVRTVRNKKNVLN